MHSIFVLADSTGKPSERGSIRGERSGRGGNERRTPLDSASRSIFSNGDLLSDIQSEDPFSIGGIYGTSRGLKVSKNGDFGGLSCVGLSKPAAVSVLSKTQMLDSGKEVSFDQTNDVYHLTTGMSTYTFGRIILDNGRKSGHYA